MPTKLIINGKPRAVSSSPDTPLLWVLRDELGMTAMARIRCRRPGSPKMCRSAATVRRGRS